MSEDLRKLAEEAFALIQQRKWDEAIAVLTKPISQETDLDKEFGLLYHYRGDAYLAKGDFDKAINDYSKAIENGFSNVFVYTNRGNAYSLKGQYDEAIADFDEAIRLNPENNHVYHYRGDAYVGKEDFDKAINDYSKAIENGFSNVSVYTNRGNAYSLKGQYDEAIADFDEAIRLNPENNRVYYNRGNAYLEKGDFDKAINDYSKAIENGFSHVPVYTSRGNAHSSKGQYDEAIADFDEAIRLNPENNHVYHYRGDAYLGKRDFDKAINDYSKAIENGFSHVSVYTNRGNAYLLKGQYDEAIADYNEAERLDDRSVTVYCNRGNAYLRKYEYSRAISDFNKAIKLNPRYAEAYNGLGNVYGEMGECGAALVNYGKAEECDPHYVNIYNNRAVIYNKQRKYDEAIDSYNKLIEKQPSAPAYHNLALTYYNKGNYKDVFENYDKALERDPNHAITYSARGLLHHRCCAKAYSEEDYEEAKCHAQKARGDFEKADESKGGMSFEAKRIDDLMREMESLDSEEKKRFYNFYIRVSEIRNALFLGPLPPKAWHYCSLDTLKNLARGPQSSTGKFRLYNADYMDDLEEGEALLEILSNHDFNVKKVFYKNEEEHQPISPEYYVGSFSWKDEEDLFLWRAYGKQNGVDAAGACLVFGSFAFSSQISPLLGTYQLLAELPPERGLSKPPLFKVVYKGDVEEDKELKTLIAELEKALKGLEEVDKTHGLVRELLDEIRFLFKSDHYKEEKEARVIVVMPSSDREHKDRVKIDCDKFPPRFYVEPFKGETVKEISLGPQVKGGVSEWKEVIKRSESLKYAKWLGKSGIKYGAK